MRAHADRPSTATAPADGAPETRRVPRRRIVVGLFLTTTIVLAAVIVGGATGGNGSARRPTEGSNYKVRSGDTVASVADLHAISPERLMEANGLTLSDSLEPTTRLVVPDPPTEGREPPAELLDEPVKLTYAPMFDRVSDQYDLPPGLLEALAWHESAWVNALVSDDGRTGLGQLRSEIVLFLRREVVQRGLQPTDPEGNIELTGAYLGHLLDGSEGDRAAALAGYYLGQEGPAGGTWDLDVVSFVRTVLGLAPDFAGTLPAPPASRSTTTTASD